MGYLTYGLWSRIDFHTHADISVLGSIRSRQNVKVHIDLDGLRSSSINSREACLLLHVIERLGQCYLLFGRFRSATRAWRGSNT